MPTDETDDETTIPTHLTPFVLCDRCGIEAATARVLPCGHGLGPVCEAREGSAACPYCGADT